MLLRFCLVMLATISLKATGLTCTEEYAKLIPQSSMAQNANKWVIQAGTYALSNSYKLITNPFLMPFVLAHDSVKSIANRRVVGLWASPTELFSEGVFYVSGLYMFYELSDYSAISIHSFHNKTDPIFLDGLTKDSVIVVANAFYENDWLNNIQYGVVNASAEHMQRTKFPKLEVIDPRSVKHLTQELLRIHKKSGRIDRLDVYGHGSSGYLDLLDSDLSVDTFADHSQLAFINELKSKQILSESFKIRFNSCEMVGGVTGQSMIKAVDQNLLNQNSHMMASSKVTVNSGINELATLLLKKPLPPWMERSSDVAFAPYRFVMGYVMNFKDASFNILEKPVNIHQKK